ncbi:mitochondrial inner membrane protein COX18-like [Centruroides sculpturatus]|uniref:mitochondrial inner membrane protein COX18-like n=1 Tax=Centruroides sculpturatus TaxID=218467 RepID=UPI000C6E29BA|nr:mitochondrial inner membrane protein COX18-like [Centruroides sculpturatus]
MFWFRCLNNPVENSASYFMRNSYFLHKSTVATFPAVNRVNGFHSCINYENTRCRMNVICSYTQYRKFSMAPLVTSVATSKPVEMAQELLEWIHLHSGMPWWMTLLSTTVTLRLVLFPLVVYQQYILARYENLLPEIKNLSVALKKEVDLAVKMFKWDEKVAKIQFKKNLRRHIDSLIVRDNCHPFKSIIVVGLQLPTWISLSFALRNMVNFMPYGNQVPTFDMTYLEMTVGGTLWFPNLTIPDQLLIIPVLLGIVNLTITEVHTLRKFRRNTKLQKLTTNLFRCFSIILIPIAITMPSCITLYWLQSSLFGLAQNLFLQVPRVRRMFRIPRTPSESQTPFQDMAEELKNKFKFIN